MRVLVSDKLSERGINFLKNADSIEVDVKVGLSQEEIIDIIGQYDGLAIRSATQRPPQHSRRGLRSPSGSHRQ